MLHNALSFLRDQLNQSIGMKFRLLPDEDMVIVGKLILSDGSIPEDIKNKMVLSFVNLDLETQMGSSDTRMGFAPSGKSDRLSMHNVNVNVLLTSNFFDENEALKFLSAALKFFHGTPSFDRSSHPEMDEGLDKISVEVCNLSLLEFNSLWSSIGAKATPSILYKVRIIASIDNSVLNAPPLITPIDPENANS
jgi:hypothetical protein